jgi:hypothetical protein
MPKAGKTRKTPPEPYAGYELHRGFVHRWLIAGPQLIPPAAGSLQQMTPQAAAESFCETESGISEPPLEEAKIKVAGPGPETEIRWWPGVCQDDHILDVSQPLLMGNYVRYWAYTELISASEQRVRLVLHSYGPIFLWLNGRALLQHKEFNAGFTDGVSCDATLVKGRNTVLIRFEQLVTGPCPYAIALQVDAATDKVSVRVPSKTTDIARRRRIEDMVARAYVERDLYANEDGIIVKWPANFKDGMALMVRLQKENGETYSEGHPQVKAGSEQGLMSALQLADGPYQVRVLPEPSAFYEQGMRVERRLDFSVIAGDYVGAPRGEPNDRRGEALVYAARHTYGIFTDIARMALKWWAHVFPDYLEAHIKTVVEHEPGCHRTLIGLLHVAYRYVKHPEFPAEVVEPLERCILGFDYEREEAAGPESAARAEDEAILRHTCSVLAGQFYPDKTFDRVGRTGRSLRQRGQCQAMEWLARRAEGGFAAWDSNETFASCLVALSHLVEFARSDSLAEMATAITDKLLFTLAENSWNGVFGSTHGSTSARSVTDARAEATSGVCRLLFEMGSFNQDSAAPVSLVCCEQYKLPTIFAAIASDRRDEMLARERHVVAWKEQDGALAPAADVNKVTYRTKEYMLASAQDYRPGERGAEEHIWHATLGPDATVFVTHPGNNSLKDLYRPNFWCGNRLLPRVAQWNNALIAIHRLPDDDWMRYTHAHFPVAAFDQYTIRAGWAFARKGDGYLALKATQGFELITSGQSAFRELRSFGHDNIWICILGSSTRDSRFAVFQKKVLGLPIQVNGLHVVCPTPGGDVLEFGWTGPFLVNGVEQALSGFKHYDSPYCVAELGAAAMDMKFGESMLRLHLEQE